MNFVLFWAPLYVVFARVLLQINAQVIFVNVKKTYEVRNNQPPETVVAEIKAIDPQDRSARLVYDLYDASGNDQYRIDRYTGELLTAKELQSQAGANTKLVVVATNMFTADNIREIINVKILVAMNKFAPQFPSNGSTIFIERNANSSQTVWIADAVDADPDEVNNDIIYTLDSIEPGGFLEFLEQSGELKLLKPARDLPEKQLTVNITACNREEAVPNLCTFGIIFLASDIPNSDELIASLQNIDAAKMGLIANAIEKMSDYAKTDVKIAQSMVTVISAVLDVDPVKLGTAMTTDVSQQLTRSVGSYANNAVILNNSSTLSLKTDNVEINLLDVQASALQEVLQFHAEKGHQFDSYSYGNTSSNITFAIPKEVLLSGSGQGTTLRISFVLYENSNLFKQAKSETPIKLAGLNLTNITDLSDAPVIVAAVANMHTHSLQAPVTFKMAKPDFGLKYRCVYWVEKENKWSSDGLSATEQNSESIECSSGHMTAFSILFDPTPDAGIAAAHKLALSLISYIGCGLSIFGSFATVITYSFFNQLHSDRAGKILINLSLAIGFLNVTFIFGSLLPILPFDVPCAVPSTLIHFFALSSFMWMGIEGYNMHQLLVRVMHGSQERHFLAKRIIIGWGLPLIISASATTLEIFNDEEIPYGEECRLIPNNTFVYYGAFLAPIAVVILCNFFVFIMVVYVLCKPRPDFANVATKKTPESRSVRGVQVHGSLAVMFLLGVTWVFGALAFSHARILFQYVFCLMNSSQGFLIYVFRCLERRDARMAWVNFFKTGKRRLPIESRSTRSTINSSTGGSVTWRKDVHGMESPARKPLLRKNTGNVAFMENDLVQAVDLIDKDL